MRSAPSDYMTKPIDRERLVGLLQPLWRARPAARCCWSRTTPITRELMRSMLEREHWLVTEAEQRPGWRSSGWRATAPDLILLDLMMPEMDGFQLIAALQEKPQWRSIPVIVITALDLTAADHARLNSGVEAILLKESFDPTQLVETVRHLVAESRRTQNLQEAGS